MSNRNVGYLVFVLVVNCFGFLGKNARLQKNGLDDKIGIYTESVGLNTLQEIEQRQKTVRHVSETGGIEARSMVYL